MLIEPTTRIREAATILTHLSGKEGSVFYNILDKPIGASPRMFSVELWCTGSCFGHAGMVHRGGSINSYGIACSMAIPPLAIG